MFSRFNAWNSTAPESKKNKPANDNENGHSQSDFAVILLHKLNCCGTVDHRQKSFGEISNTAADHHRRQEFRPRNPEGTGGQDKNLKRCGRRQQGGNNDREYSMSLIPPLNSSDPFIGERLTEKGFAAFSSYRIKQRATGDGPDRR